MTGNGWIILIRQALFAGKATNPLCARNMAENTKLTNPILTELLDL